jgi:glycine cleavage system H protein
VAERRYSETHEWVSVEGGTATVGITDFAQAQLGDVVFLDLPNTDTHLQPGASFGVIESVKAASDLYSPVAGRVTEVNERLRDSPELINHDPYGEGWLIKVAVDGDLPPNLLDEAGYKKVTESA